ncbi:MAG: right-handed parallel beta-helix repeat-containing protein [Chloroflexi bacterium]|nr:right-handed parallel beta-helix repeat-containing protein [Chloroflexota bacterium]
MTPTEVGYGRRTVPLLGIIAILALTSCSVFAPPTPTPAAPGTVAPGTVEPPYPTPPATGTVEPPYPTPPTAIPTGTEQRPYPTPTVTPTATPPNVTFNPNWIVQVLCDGQVFDGYTKKLFVLNSARDQDPNIQKVIRNCTFRNSAMAAIVLQNAKNVLIEGNTFENIRTRIAGDGVHAINIPCPAGCAIDNITIRNNVFKDIGADGVQIGQDTRNVTNVFIQNNEFSAQEGVGENGVDVKGAEGPIYITGNKMHGFRPCRSPKTTPPGIQDCTGSSGPAITIHDGGIIKTPAFNVIVENNELYDNVYGLSISAGAKNITVRGNRIFNNLQMGIEVDQVYSLSISGNTLSGNPTHILLSKTPLSGGSCALTDNTFIGGVINIKGGC